MVLFIYSFYFDEQQKQRSSVECFTVNMFWHNSPQIPLNDLLHKVFLVHLKKFK